MYITTLDEGEMLELWYDGEDAPFYQCTKAFEVFHVSDPGKTGRDGWTRWYRDDRCVASVTTERFGNKRAEVRVDAADEVEIIKKGF
jgi:hypothetical protein